MQRYHAELMAKAGAELEPGAAAAAPEPGSWVQHRLQLDSGYVEEFENGTLDIAAAVAAPDCAPLLVVHGEADAQVPLCHGEQLFDAAAEPKQIFVIPKANHLLTSTSHLKKATNAILNLIATNE